jgi:hypothetical protein
MDVFLKTIETKSTQTFFAPGKITCVHGKSGIGKTHFVTSVLNPCIFIDHEVFKSRQGTLDFFERLEYTSTPIVIDNWESVQDLIGVREITKALTRGPTIIISRFPVDIPDVIIYAMPEMSIEDLIKLGGKGSEQLASECHGDIRMFMNRLKYNTDSPDSFETPREFVEIMLNHPRPVDFINRTVHEHGYTWAVIQENYVDTKKITMDEIAEVADSHSLADVYDTKLYKDNSWDTLFHYFVLAACVYPCSIIHGRLNTRKLRAGSLWTKFQNTCMRAKKITSTRLSRESLVILRVYVEHGQFEILKDYSLEPSAIDVMNHLGQTKLRPKMVEQAKKFLR